MAEASSIGSPLETAAGAVGPRAVEAFSVLGHETRLAILLALWEAYEPFAAENAVPFAELRKRVGMRDGSQFNYHLSRLVGHYVGKTERGYELRHAGHQLVRAVIAGAGIEDPTLEPTEVDQRCPVCGASTNVLYRDERLFQVCTECDGRLGGMSHYRPGTLVSTDLDPAGVHGRTPDELLNAGFVRGMRIIQSGIEGVCAVCSGPIERWLNVCTDHPSEGMCPTCGRRYDVMVRFRCPVCKAHSEVDPSCSWLVLHHPAVVAFYYDRGIPVQYESAGTGSFQPRFQEIDFGKDVGYELLSADPPRVRVTFRHEGDELALTLDEEANVVDVYESS
jgi:DNA-binding transcriptional ArsR family regulator